MCYNFRVPDDQVHIRYDGGARNLQELFCRIMGCTKLKTRFWLFSTGPDEPIKKDKDKMKLDKPIKPGFRRPFTITPDEPVDINNSGTYVQAVVLIGDSTVTIDPASSATAIKGWLNGDGSTGENTVRFQADGHLGDGDQPVSLDVDFTVASPDATLLGFVAGVDEAIPV